MPAAGSAPAPCPLNKAARLLACSIIAISLLPSHCVQGPPVAPRGPVLPSAVLLPLHPGEAVGTGLSPPSPPQHRAGGAVLARRLLSRQASCWGGGPRPRSGMGGTSIAHRHQGLAPNGGAMPRAGHRDCLGEVHLGVQGVGLCCVSPAAHRHGRACALPTPRQLCPPASSTHRDGEELETEKTKTSWKCPFITQLPLSWLLLSPSLGCGCSLVRGW